MKAGTAQKIILNLFSTAVMVKMGRVYRGLMVDMRARNAKLRRRAAAIVGEIVRCPESDAVRHLEQADGDVKTAILIGFGSSGAEAAELLQRHGGHLRAAIIESKTRSQSKDGGTATGKRDGPRDRRNSGGGRASAGADGKIRGDRRPD